MLKKDYEKVKRKKQLLIVALAVLTIVCAYIFTTIGIAKAGIDQTLLLYSVFLTGLLMLVLMQQLIKLFYCCGCQEFYLLF